MKNTWKHSGFSLVEMLVVIAIIALLASMMLGVSEYIGTQSKHRALKATFTLLDSALQQYYDYWDAFPDPNRVNTPVYPSRSAALYGQLYSTPECRAIIDGLSNKLIRNNIDNIPEIMDPWGTVLDYLYVPGDTFPMIVSAGPDKNLVTVGDNITNK